MDLLKKFQDYIKKESLVNFSDRILLGVSGGPDSLTMLDLFNRIKEEFNLELFVFHLNHMFREEAQEEAEFVDRVCTEYNIKAVIEEYDVPALIREKGLSPEEAARQVRLDLMLKTAYELSVKKIALAHNKDDLVETVFLHMFRGTGLKGLTGINPVTKMNGVKLIHPLINIYRRDIEDYCQVRGLKPKHDPTNQETIYTRNKIRHKIISYIEKEINPGVKDVMAQMANVLREEEAFLAGLAEKKFNEVLIQEENNKVILSLPTMQNTAKVIRRRLIQKAIYGLKEDYTNLYFEHFKAIDNLILHSTTGKKINLPENIKVKRIYDQLIIQKGGFQKAEGFTLKLTVPGYVKLPGKKIIWAEITPYYSSWRSSAKNQQICICDVSKVDLPLVVRNRQPGDKFYPLGMKGMKKLKDFFIDEKIPQNERDQIPVVVDNSGQIVWVAGLRMDDRIKVTNKTEELLKLILTEEKGD